MRTAIYAGSFDPITRGHEDLIKRTLQFVDHIVVAVATNVSKQPLFTLESASASFARQWATMPAWTFANSTGCSSTSRDRWERA